MLGTHLLGAADAARHAIRVLMRRRAILPLAGAMATALVASAVGAARAFALGARPAPSGTSATRCAQCGAPDHTMLDARCPRAQHVRV